jgi:mono/diheme cytochrome c family protein
MRRTVWFLLIACVPCAARSEVESGPPSDPPTVATKPREGPADPDALHTVVRPFLAKYCTSCHGPTRPKGGLDLSSFPDETARKPRRRTLERVREYVDSGIMPPEDSPQPTRDEGARLSRWIKSKLERDELGAPSNPGRVTIRRLNRAEYNNTIRDLIGVDFRPADDFPSDDVGYGFDNIGDVLSLPPVLMERYLAAAASISERAIVPTPNRLSAEPLPESHRRIIFREPKSPAEYQDAARAILERFATRAYRRPVRPDETSRLSNLVELALRNGESFERGIQLAVQAVLISPHFLFRVELDSRPRGPGEAARLAQGIEPIGDYELASRLSYFLWSTMPDEELFGLAAQGKLHEAEVLSRQVKRMLREPRSRALVENFAGQWLQIRNLKTVNPDRDRFPDFDEPLREAMLRETELFTAEIIYDDRSVLDFLDADFTYVNERLARHYGMPGISGEAFRRVRLHDSMRGGLLTHASILTVTSNPNRTSPVKRGRWILEQILGTPPPPPPPGVAPLTEDRAADSSLSLRQRMEQHRARPNCAVCHNRLDPLGFGLENYDGVGAWREKEGGQAVDASGTLPSGESFRGPGELKAILKARPREFARCLTEKMLTYALGRGLEDYDRAAVERIVKDLESHRYRFSTLVLDVVMSDPFLKRRL